MAIKNTNTSPLLKEGANITLTQSGQVITIAANDTTNAPGGSDTQVQFNDGGNFGGDSGLTYNKTSNILGVESIDFVQTPTAVDAERRLHWDNDEGSLVFTLKGGNVTIPVGQEVTSLVYNAEATTLNKGEVVYAFGASGQRISVKRAVNTADSTSAQTLGVVAESIAAGAEGFVMVQGMVRGLNTSTYVQGDTLYLGATSGTFTKTKPYAPNHLVYVGFVVKVNASSGEIFVKPQNGYEMAEIHDYQQGSVQNNDVVSYESSSGLYKPKGIVTLLGFTPAPASRMITINGTSQDLTADRTWSVGTVTSVGLSAPTGFSVANSPVISSGTLALSFASGYSLPTTASQTNWDAAYTNRITSLTTTGSSGAATLISNTLNIPNYTLSGLLPSLTSGSVLFSNGTTIAQDNANLFWDDSNNRLGIGTTTPAAKLEVVSGNSDAISWKFSSSYGQSTIGTIWDSTSNAGNKLTFNVNTAAGTPTTVMTLLGDGSVTANGQIFSVTDNVEQFTLKRASNNNHQVLLGRYSTYGYIQSLTQGTSYDSFVINPNGGNCLIGTTTDGGQKLQVSGNSLFNGSAGVAVIVNGDNNWYAAQFSGGSTTGQSYGPLIQAGTNSSDISFIVQNKSGASNYFSVRGDGVATFSSSVTASSFVKSGGTSTQYLMADGSTSTLSGSGVIIKATNVTGVGDSVIPSSTGSNLSAFGYYALNSNSTGYGNTAIGSNSLSNITTGYYNIAIGFLSGYYIQSGSNNTTSNNSIYLGYDTRPSANGNTYEIVIGSGSVGNGSNTATIGDSNTTTYTNKINVTGGQIKFPATQNASSDANTLDDYEENTWTPAFGNTGASITYATNGQVGAYTKIGRQVTCTFRLALSTSTMTGNALTITGLPFTSANVTNQEFICAIAWTSSVTNFVNVQARIGASTNVITLLKTTAAAANSTTAMVGSDIGTGSVISGTITYFV